MPWSNVHYFAANSGNSSPQLLQFLHNSWKDDELVRLSQDSSSPGWLWFLFFKMAWWPQMLPLEEVRTLTRFLPKLTSDPRLWMDGCDTSPSSQNIRFHPHDLSAGRDEDLMMMMMIRSLFKRKLKKQKENMVLVLDLWRFRLTKQVFNQSISPPQVSHLQEEQVAAAASAGTDHFLY